MNKDFFCKLCMFKKECKNFCLLENKNSYLKNIIWLNINDYSYNFLSLNISNQKIEYIQPDDLFIINSYNDFLGIFSPLIGRYFLVNNKLILEKKPKLIFNNIYNDELIKSGLFLSKTSLQRINKKLFYRPQIIDKLRIAFSSGCSLNCHYCYANSNKLIKKIDFDKLKFILDNFPLNFELKKLDLHGNGEPTFDFIELKKVVNLIKNKYHNINISIQSNGQFSKTIAKWLLSNNIHTGLSFDGPEIIQNNQRPSKLKNKSSFKNIIENFNFFKENGKITPIISTITSFSESQLETIYNFFKNIGCNEILINPIMIAGKANPSNMKLNKYSKSCDLNIFAEMFPKLLFNSIQDNIRLRSRLLAGFLNPPLSHNCGISRPTLIFLPDGLLTSCCETLESINPENNIFILGKCYTDNIEMKYKNIEILRQRYVYNMKSCENCFLKWQCSGSCAADSYLENNDIFKPVERLCIARKKIAYNFFNILSDIMKKYYI